MMRVECVRSSEVNPDHMREMLANGWVILDCYHLNGLVTTVYERSAA